MKNIFKIKLFLLFLFLGTSIAIASELDVVRSDWKGHTRYDFKFNDRQTTIVLPHKAAEGKPWIWRPAFFGAFSWVDEALLEKGYHIAYYDVTHLYGSPRAVKLGTEFYNAMCEHFQLSDKVTLEGFSRGGYFTFNWAAANPDKVACIYVDAPVCDITSWPGRKRTNLWNDFLKEWDVKDEDVTTNFRGNALQLIDKLIEAKIPIIGVCGNSDKTVPYKDNFKKVAENYQQKGGIVETIIKPGIDHHPHSLENPEAIIDFIVRYQKGYTDKQHINFRHNLTNSFHKFIKEKKGCVAFLGGSITEMKGWRQQVQEDLHQRFPHTEFTFIDAGIGSTGSVPHSFRMTQDVFEKGTPDLMFVEAAVNDFTNTPDHVQQLRGMEGIIRHARMVNPYMDIVMLHFTCDGFIGYFNKGIIPDVIMNHERVANYYFVTSVNLAQEISERMDSGDFNWKTFGGTHPSWFGHKFYTASINRVFDNSTLPINEYKPSIYVLPQNPIDKYSYFPGQFLDIKSAKKLKGFKIVENWQPENPQGKTRKGFCNVPMLVGLDEGCSFELNFTGRAIGYFGVCGPDAGIISYSIDGEKYKEINTYTQWSKQLYIPWLYILADNLSEGKHTLKVKMKKGKGSACHIRNFTVLGKDNIYGKVNLMKNQENKSYYFEDYKK